MEIKYYLSDEAKDENCKFRAPRLGDAGYDLYASVTTEIGAGQLVLLPTGLRIEIQPGYVGIIKDRSGVASKAGLHTLAGVIDSSYRGEIKILFYNTSDRNLEIVAGGKIAQMIIVPFVAPQTEEVSLEELSETARGDGGFGSTGE